ncbi:hypothetical protein Dimus_012786 [Dionaea muscipula]
MVVVKYLTVVWAVRGLPGCHLSTNNVRKVVSEADSYQPHLITPEQGIRILIDGSLGYFKGPAEATIDAVTFLFILFTYFCFPSWILLRIIASKEV